jgi:hypothetical protein
MSNDTSDYLNGIADTTNKMLALLNSGAFIAVLHYWSQNGRIDTFENYIITPALAFVIGLTLIMITAACNYFNALFYFYKEKEYTLLMWAATICAIGSGLSFLYGAWLVALVIQ